MARKCRKHAGFGNLSMCEIRPGTLKKWGLGGKIKAHLYKVVLYITNHVMSTQQNQVIISTAKIRVHQSCGIYFLTKGGAVP